MICTCKNVTTKTRLTNHTQTHVVRNYSNFDHPLNVMNWEISYMRSWLSDWMCFVASIKPDGFQKRCLITWDSVWLWGLYLCFLSQVSKMFLNLFKKSLRGQKRHEFRKMHWNHLKGITRKQLKVRSTKKFQFFISVMF